MEIDFAITGDFIELIKLLKVTAMAENGGHAKLLVDDNLIKVNGVIETRKRAKLKPGDKIECPNGTITLYPPG